MRYRTHQRRINFLLASPLTLHLSCCLPQRSHCVGFQFQLFAHQIVLAFSKLVLLGLRFIKLLLQLHSQIWVYLDRFRRKLALTFRVAQVVFAGQAFQRLQVLLFLLSAGHSHLINLALIDQISQLVTLRHSLHRASSGQSYIGNV